MASVLSPLQTAVDALKTQADTFLASEPFSTVESVCVADAQTMQQLCTAWSTKLSAAVQAEAAQQPEGEE